MTNPKNPFIKAANERSSEGDRFRLEDLAAGVGETIAEAIRTIPHTEEVHEIRAAVRGVLKRWASKV